MLMQCFEEIRGDLLEAGLLQCLHQIAEYGTPEALLPRAPRLIELCIAHIERDDGSSAPIRSATSPSPLVVSQHGPRAEAAKRGKIRSCLVLLCLARDVASLLDPGETQLLRYRLRVLEALEAEHLEYLA